jgi:hypothetical protein
MAGGRTAAQRLGHEHGAVGSWAGTRSSADAGVASVLDSISAVIK